VQSSTSEPEPGPRWWIPVGGAVAIVVIVVVAYGVSSGAIRLSSEKPVATGPFDILPSPGTPSGCVVDQPGEPRATYNLDDGVLQPNTYAIPNGTAGAAGMCYNSATGAMFAYVNWSHVASPGGWFSYPQIAYGVNSFAGSYSTYTGQSPAWSLPQTVATITGDSVWLTTNYQFNAPSSSVVSRYDLSFDELLGGSLPPVFAGDPYVEVEIMMDHNVNYPHVYFPWSTPTLVGSTLASEPWGVGFWCHGAGNTTSDYASFDFLYGGAASHGIAEGQFGVNLSAIFLEVDSLAPHVSCWNTPTTDFSTFHLEEANFGSEDEAIAGASYNYNWTIDEYCVHPGLMGANVTNLSTC
jgi:hypothetical protein